MVLQYTYHSERFTLSVDWNDFDGRSTIHTAIVEKLAKRHDSAFLGYWEMAQELDEKADKLYRCIHIFNDESHATPYNPKIRKQFLEAFSDLCSCLEMNLESDGSENAQALSGLFLSIQSTLQEMVGVYLVDNAYQGKHRYRRANLEEWVEMIDESRIAYEFESVLLQMTDLSRLLERLTDTQRRRLISYFLLGHTMQEIANQEGVSKQSVEESITAALKKLRSLQ